MQTNPKSRKFGIAGLAICALLTGAVIALITPWAFHMGGRLTPFYWSGTGMLVTKSGTYPLYVLFYPATTETLHGWGSLCTSRNSTIPLDVRGAVNHVWWSLDRAPMEIALGETHSVRETLFDPSSGGGVDLLGNWHGPELVLNAQGEAVPFHSGLKLEHASVTLKWGSKSDFEALCSRESNPAAAR